MKTSKRSLIMAIAILCVCALSLTAASYAWFTSAQSATLSELTMSVDKRTNLQLSVDNTNWKATLTNQDFIDAKSFNSAAKLNDVSTNNFTNWVKAAYQPDGTYTFSEGATAISDTVATGDYLMLKVYFRSTEAKPVVMNGTYGAANALTAAVRLGFDNNGAKIYASNSSTAQYTPVSGTPADLTFAGTSLANAQVTTLTDGGDGYYYGSTVLYLWIEGTDAACIDSNSGTTVTANLNFGMLDTANA